jgi:hypothetical protein
MILQKSYVIEEKVTLTEEDMRQIAWELSGEDIQLLFRTYQTAKPYCTDDPQLGLQIRPGIETVKRRYTQQNSP